MRVYLNKYKNHWISPYTICEKICFWREIDYDEPWVKMVNKVLEPIMTVWMNFLHLVYPKINYVKIDRWDTWSMDYTLAHMIVPMLKQLQNTKHGYPLVADEDVPEYMRTHMATTTDFEWSPDDLAEMRWDWILNEMIWSFECKLKDDDEDEYYDRSECEGLSFEDSIGKLNKSRLKEIIDTTSKKQIALRGEIIIKKKTYESKYKTLYIGENN